MDPHMVLSFPPGRNGMITNDEAVTERGSLTLLPLSPQAGRFLAQREGRALTGFLGPGGCEQNCPEGQGPSASPRKADKFPVEHSAL